MKRQIGFAEAESKGTKRVTKRQRFLTEMDKLVPWPHLLSAIEPYYPKGKRGRLPIGLERMLRIYFLQQWYGLLDEGLEDALYDSIAMRAFAGIDLAVEDVPDATTLLKFRRLLVEHDLTRKLFDEIGILLCERGLLMKEGTLVDATIIEAPPSTKNAESSRDPEMHQTKKGNEWHFGMKAHVGVDADSGLVHSLVGTSANVSDVLQAHALLHGHEREAFGDAGYPGVEKRDEMKGNPVQWRVAVKRGKIKAMRDGGESVRISVFKARIRARVEHPFPIVKNLFHHRKVRYKGLTKNTAQLFSLFALANLVIAKNRLRSIHGGNPSCV
ncbi:IS5 family transposase [Trinickia sp.]|uniref:IS5 family transposase n=1 Tax=Trinickia sp. TaxID=2571163 RepID=UPI0039C964D9